MTKSEYNAKLFPLYTLKMSMSNAAENSDHETAHQQADDILIKAVRLLADRADLADVAEEMLEIYFDMVKWYA